MVYTFARIGAATAMKVEDVYVQNRRLWVNLREKGGKAVALPCHHALEAYLHAYLDDTGMTSDPQGPLFRTIGRGTGRLTRTPLPQANAYAMIQRRARAAGLRTRIGNHTFRATGITAYLKNGGTLKKAAMIANHASTRTTQLYDRRSDEVSLAALPGSLRHPVSGRDPQEGDDDNRDDSFGRGWFGPGWPHVAPTQARCGPAPVAGGGPGDTLSSGSKPNWVRCCSNVSCWKPRSLPWRLSALWPAGGRGHEPDRLTLQRPALWPGPRMPGLARVSGHHLPPSLLLPAQG